MKVLITNLSGIKTEAGGAIKHFAKAGSRWPMIIGQAKSVDYYPFPFWLAYAHSLIKRDTSAQVKGIDGVVLDLDRDSYLEQVKEFGPDLLITELTTIALADDLDTLREIKKNSRAKIAIVGNYPTAAGEKLLRENSFIDFALIGEYEETAKELVGSLINNNPLNNIPGLMYRSNDGITKNENRPLLKDLDYLPYPEREDFPATLYPDFAIYSPCINIMASRGCPAGCIYCQERHIMYASPVYRMREPKKVVAEMEYCRDKFKARQFYFDDQSFTVNQQNTQDICQEMIDRRLNIPWTCMGDAMFVNKKTLEFMAKAKCIGMKFGVESASPQILKRIGKPLDLEKLKQVVKWCKDLGIRTHATFIIGLPGASRESILGDMKFLDELKPFTAQVALATPYPGTPFYQWAKESNFLVTEDLSKYDGMGQSVINYPNLSKEEMEKLHQIFFKKVSRQKLIHFILSPRSSFSIMKEMCQRKGLKSLLNSLITVVKRAV